MAKTKEHTTRSEQQKELKRRRARARRASRKGAELILDAYKPIDQWDNEELAHGRPRAVDGTFRGPKPQWLTAQTAEEAAKRFKQLSRDELRVMILEGMPLLQRIIHDNSTDKRGRPTIPVSVKWDALKWLLEMEHGKPTTRIEGDISVRLQAMLGSVLVNPDGQPAISVPGMVDAESWEEEDEDNEGIDEE